MSKGNVAVLLSGRGSNFASIVRASRAGDANFAVRLAISDRADAAGLKKASRFGIPAHFVDPTRFPDKAAYERRICELLEREAIDLVCLAGYMRLVGPVLLGRYRRPHPEHPPGPAALLSRPGRPAPGAATTA